MSIAFVLLVLAATATASEKNSSSTAEAIETSEPVLSAMVKEGRLTVVGARYHLDNDEVEILV